MSLRSILSLIKYFESSSKQLLGAFTSGLGLNVFESCLRILSENNSSGYKLSFLTWPARLNLKI